MAKEKKGKSQEKEIEQKVPDFESRWKRAVADYRNLESRVAREREELVKFSNFLLISNLLPVLDDLSEAAKKGGDEGAVQIFKKLESILQDAGLEEIEAKGKNFDPEVMEGLPAEGKSPKEKGQALEVPELGSRTPSEPSSKSMALGNSDSKVVVEVMRKGYTLNGRLLRAARVKVEWL